MIKGSLNPYEDMVNDMINDTEINIVKIAGKHFHKNYTMPIKVEKLPGRNELCPCGSGKKYKFCCLKNVNNVEI
jgi:Predicted metal-binding protein related to the C-terminal domain of SecA